jgi:hypothetical protein
MIVVMAAGVTDTTTKKEKRDAALQLGPDNVIVSENEAETSNLNSVFNPVKINVGYLPFTMY